MLRELVPRIDVLLPCLQLVPLKVVVELPAHHRQLKHVVVHGHPQLVPRRPHGRAVGDHDAPRPQPLDLLLLLLKRRVVNARLRDLPVVRCLLVVLERLLEPQHDVGVARHEAQWIVLLLLQEGRGSHAQPHVDVVFVHLDLDLGVLRPVIVDSVRLHALLRHELAKELPVAHLAAVRGGLHEGPAVLPVLSRQQHVDALGRVPPVQRPAQLVGFVVDAGAQHELPVPAEVDRALRAREAEDGVVPVDLHAGVVSRDLFRAGAVEVVGGHVQGQRDVCRGGLGLAGVGQELPVDAGHGLLVPHLHLVVGHVEGADLLLGDHEAAQGDAGLGQGGVQWELKG